MPAEQAIEVAHNDESHPRMESDLCFGCSGSCSNCRCFCSIRCIGITFLVLFVVILLLSIFVYHERCGSYSSLIKCIHGSIHNGMSSLDLLLSLLIVIIVLQRFLLKWSLWKNERGRYDITSTTVISFFLSSLAKTVFLSLFVIPKNVLIIQYWNFCSTHFASYSPHFVVLLSPSGFYKIVVNYWPHFAVFLSTEFVFKSSIIKFREVLSRGGANSSMAFESVIYMISLGGRHRSRVAVLFHFFLQPMEKKRNFFLCHSKAWFQLLLLGRGIAIVFMSGGMLWHMD